MEIMPSSAVAWSHVAMKLGTSPDGIAVDLTAGNGYDTLFLAKRMKKVYAFDIQTLAIENTEKLLQKEGIDGVVLIRDTHEHFHHYLDPKTVDIYAMNLGYLPRGDKSVTTRWESTKRTIDGVLAGMKKGAILSLCVYPHHAEGARESAGLKTLIETLDQRLFHVSSIRFPNQRNDPPYWIGIERC